MKRFITAFRLMTSLPMPDTGEWQAGDSGRAATWYPFVGLCLGGLVAFVLSLLRSFAPLLVAAVLALIFWVALTGGLHLDGLSDCFDGMFHASSPECRLQIMKDSHIGAFGVVGLVLTLLVKFSLLASLTPEHAAGAILLAASLARWCVAIAGTQPMARPTGMGADFAAGLTKSTIVLGALIPLGVVIWLKAAGLLALSAGFLAMLIIVRLAKANLGGVTGDVLGMIIEIVEVIVLLVFGLIP
jgi:adenosylcobinamide-GDP ribazoletransferase